MTIYMAIPKASDAVVEVATTAAAKTVLQIKPVTNAIRILGWGLSFDGIVVTNPPGKVELIDVDVTATVTTLTPEEWGSSTGGLSTAVGGTAATGYNATVEGAITGSRLLDAQNIHPQGGYAVWWPTGPIVQAARFLRIRTTYSVDINCIPWIAFEELV